MLISLASCALCATPVAPAPCVTSVQAPDLFVLARLNRIMKLSNYDSPVPQLETLVTYENSFFGFPRGLEIDRATGNFYVLLSDFSSSSLTESTLLTVDAQTGTTLAQVSIPIVPALSGANLGMTIDETGAILVQEFGGHQPPRHTIDPATGLATTE